MAESLDSIHEQLTTISGKLGRVQGITEGIAEKVERINGRINHVENELKQHASDDSVIFSRIFAKLSFWRGVQYLAVVVLGAAAGLFSGWFTK